MVVVSGEELGWVWVLTTSGSEGVRGAAGTGTRVAEAAGRRGRFRSCGTQSRTGPTAETRQGRSRRNKYPGLHFLPPHWTSRYQASLSFPWALQWPISAFSLASFQSFAHILKGCLSFLPLPIFRTSQSSIVLSQLFIITFIVKSTPSGWNHMPNFKTA